MSTNLFFSTLTVADLSRHRVHASGTLPRSNRRAPSIKLSLIHRLGQPGAQPTVRIDYDGDLESPGEIDLKAMSRSYYSSGNDHHA